jgi:LytR cell envelope-related transcriptional attenuator
VPALIALAALLLLTALVWWRVLHRDDGGGAAATTCSTPTPTAASLPAPSRVTVLVLNATNRTGIASRTRTRLVTDGFNVPRPAANDRHGVRIRGVAEIRYGPSGKSGARLLRYYFPGAAMVATHSKAPTVVVSLGAKFRGVASASSVEAALKRDEIELSSATPGAPSSASPTC